MTVLVLWIAACTSELPTGDAAIVVPAEPVLAMQRPSPEVAAEPKKHAVLLVIDTTRADALAEANTPVLDGLAAAGDSVPHAWSAGTWTVPSVISLLTGMSVRQHGWDQQTGRIGRYHRFPDVPTLPVVLQDAGFITTGLYANSYLSEELGFERGFDTWHRVPDVAMLGRLKKVVAEWKADERHFLYLHLMGPHSPLKPSAEARARYGLEDSWFEERGWLEIGVPKRNRLDGAREAYAKGYRA